MCVYVRDLTRHESRRLSRGLKESKNATYLRRLQVVAFSGQGMRAKEIAERLYFHEEYVRELIRRFNEGSLDSLKPGKSSGRPPEHTAEEISLIVEVASARPRLLGLPFGVWSLRKLADHVVKEGLVRKTSRSSLQRILKENGITFQRTKTWKESHDPEFESKKNASSVSTRRRRRTRA